MKYVSIVLSIVSLVIVLAILAWGIHRTSIFEKNADAKLSSMVSQYNDSHGYEHEFDKKKSNALEKVAGETIASIVHDERMKKKAQSLSLDVAGEMHADASHSEFHGIRFANTHEENSTNRISNDSEYYRKLMINGGLGDNMRKVGVLDRLDVHGDAVAQEWMSATYAHAGQYAVAGDWKAFASADGSIRASGDVDASDLLARESISIGSNGFWKMSGEGDAKLSSVRTPAGTSSHVGSFAGEQSFANLSGRSGDGVSFRDALIVENARGKTFEVDASGVVTVSNAILFDKTNGGPMLEVMKDSGYSHGIGQWPNNSTRVYAPKVGGSVEIGFFETDSFVPILAASASNVSISKDLLLGSGQTLSASNFRSRAGGFIDESKGEASRAAFGAPGVRRGIESYGQDKFYVRANDRNAMVFDSASGNISLFADTASVGNSFDENRNVTLYSGFEKGLASGGGIGFKNASDGKTRFVHDTRNGNTTIDGKLIAGGMLASDGGIANFGGAWKAEAPNDNRRSIMFEPVAPGGWNSAARSRLDPDGSMFVSGIARAGSNLCIDKECLNRDDLAKIIASRSMGSSVLTAAPATAATTIAVQTTAPTTTAVQTTAATTTAATTTAATTTIKLEQFWNANIDVPSGDLKIIGVTSRDACASECSKEPNCIGLAYRKIKNGTIAGRTDLSGKNSCWLKKEIIESKAIRNNDYDFWKKSR